MPRIARLVAIGLPHHITQRGNYRQNVFQDDQDYYKYIRWIQEYSIKHELSVLAYCLMQNHVHFIAIPNREESLSKVFNTAHMRYSQYFNKKIRIKGHLWQGRFYSCVLDEPHLIAALGYVERNPVRAKLVEKPWEWKWSSAAFHIDRGGSLIRLENISRFMDVSFDSWKQFGTVMFAQALEKRFGRKLLALPRGRPKSEH